MDKFLELRDVAKSFGPVQAVAGVSLELCRGEFFALLGPSGCGKTTLLRLLAGLERPDRGRIFLDGQEITDLPPHRRQVNTVFQNYALFPHLSVWENIAFGLRVAKRPKSEIREEVGSMLQLIQMAEQADKKPAQLSGGQKQRVAVARALINRPRVLLLDEPLAALDLKLRQRMLLELERIHEQVGITFLYVTHDQGEAMSLSQRLAVMNQGRIEQLGTPADIYEKPRSSFVAAFIGDTNFLEGVVSLGAGEGYCRLEVEGLPPLRCLGCQKLRLGAPALLSVRPERIGIASAEPKASAQRNALAVRVEEAVYLGAATRYWVRAGAQRLSVLLAHSRLLADERPLRRGEAAWIWWHTDDGLLLPGLSRADPVSASSSDQEKTGSEAGGAQAQ